MLPITIIIVKDLTQVVILGTPFVNMLYPIENLDNTGIQSRVQGYEVKFWFY